MTALFLVCAGFCAYTYLLFPLLLHLRASRRKAPEQATMMDEGGLPAVTVVIAAHNEATRLPVKLASLAELDYPQDRLELLFVSDGSTDETKAILEEASRVQPNVSFVHYSLAAGKPTALNCGVAEASGDILVFMDARQRISSNAIRALVARLADPTIGAVSGELELSTDAGSAASVGLYWRYEKWIRLSESRLFSTTGATGALYAIRREDWVPHPADVLLDDFETPIHLLARGRRTVLEPSARVFDQAESDVSGEFRRKVRTLAGNYQSFVRHRWLFNPGKNPVWWQFISHKVFRLLVPYALLGALLSAALGSSAFLNAMLWLQIAFYALGLAGFAGWNSRLASFVRTFVQLNLAAVVGAWRYVRGGASVRWKQT